ncbi:MAG: tetratricopeptide repeat protein [Actinomycetota bacterium]|nr:tetratricopeptide repeat protein [Actinomycetota bacterium]
MLARTLALLGLAVALVLIAGVALGGGADPPRAAGGPAPAGSTDDPLGRRVAQLHARVERLPGHWQAWAELGAARLEQARGTGDSRHYPAAEEAFRRSLRARPAENADALAGLSALAAARHDFGRAVSLAREAVRADPYDAPAHGALFDGLVEQGQYDEAAAALQRMANLSPGVPALARVSYLRELHGDVAGARQAMEQALASSASTPDRVFVLQQLGDLAFSTGDLDAAEARYEQGLRHDPGHLPSLAGTARVAAARGDAETAVTTLRRVVDAQPAPGYAADLGDLLASLGRQEEAEQQYAVVSATSQLIAANGGSADLEAALFAADHGQPREALTAATAEHRRRQSVFTDDALAWALHVNGRSAEALPLARRALRLGTRSALLHFHLGMIQSALGDRDAARTSLTTALQINRHFSLRHAPVARAEIARLAPAR